MRKMVGSISLYLLARADVSAAIGQSVYQSIYGSSVWRLASSHAWSSGQMVVVIMLIRSSVALGASRCSCALSWWP